MPIITTSEYKAYVNISGSAQDTQINAIIPAMQKMIERLTGCEFDKAEFTEFYDGQWASSIQLRSMPVTEIASVAAVNIGRTVVFTFPSTEYTFNAKQGILSRRVSDMSALGTGGGGWSEGVGYGNSEGYIIGDAPRFSNSVYEGIKVVYTAGYEDADMPADLKLLMYDLTTTALAGIGADMSMKSETLGHYKYERAGGGTFAAFYDRIMAWKVYG